MAATPDRKPVARTIPGAELVDCENELPQMVGLQIDMNMFSMPKKGTLERVMVEMLMIQPEGVTFLDFVGTGITADNIDQIAQNLRNAMYEAEDDNELREDA